MNRAFGPAPAGLLRRLAAAAYDVLLLCGVLLVFTAATWVARGGREIPPGTLWFQLALVAVAGLFYCWFWTHGGRTVGMLAWKIRIVRRDGGAPGWREALVRFAAAIVSLAALGLGFLWVLVDRDGLAWHDRLSRTRLVRDEPGPAESPSRQHSPRRSG
jgi:uncharacterized RDD family membrane protein YckC